MHSKILLIQPRYPSSPFPGAHLPVGLGYLAEHLAWANIAYEIVDMNFCDLNTLTSRIKCFGPHFIGLSLMSLDITSHFELATQIKNSYPQIPIIAGGPHVSFMKEQTLLDCAAIDIGIVNEGERTLVEVIRAQDYRHIKGVLFRNGAEVVFTGEPGFITDLDSCTFPRYHKFDLQRYGSRMDIISSRGCPFNCTFCGAHFSMGKKWRGRSVSSIMAEIKYWYDKGYSDFNFIDSNFFLDKERIVTLCDTLKDHNLDVSISSDGMRADDADIDLLIRMKELGLSSVAIGVESANDDILKNIRKGECVAEIEKAVKICTDLDIRVSLFFIIGLPGETAEKVENSFSFALKHPIEAAYFFNVNPLPKTELYQWAAENNYLLSSPEEMLKNIGGMGKKPLLTTPELSYQERVRLYEKGIRVSRQVNRRFKFRAITEKIKFHYTRSKNNILLMLSLQKRGLQKYHEIFTHLTIKEKLFLKHLATKIPEKGIVVEIGSYLGASACFLGLGCAKKKGKIYLVDTWANDAMTEGKKDTFSDMKQNTDDFRDFIIPLRGESSAIAATFTDKIDLLFIDADHSYKGCSSDIKNWFPHLNNNAIVIFHDYGWAEGVKGAVAALVKPIEAAPGESYENLYWTRILR